MSPSISYDPAMEWVRADGYLITDDPSRADLDTVHRWLSEESHWAQGRSQELVARSIEHSVTLSCFDPEGAQVGLARWVTDHATFGWLCDVFVDTTQRGRGLGVFLVESAMDHPAVAGLRLLLLATRDAQELYQRVGFRPLPQPERWMELRTPPLPPAH